MGIKESIWGVLGIAPPEVSKEVLHSIRDAMLKDFGRYDTTAYPALFMKIYYAADVDKLWDLRVDLRTALNEQLGEGAAAEHLDSINNLFVGHHPSAKKKRSFATLH